MRGNEESTFSDGTSDSIQGKLARELSKSAFHLTLTDITVSAEGAIALLCDRLPSLRSAFASLRGMFGLNGNTFAGPVLFTGTDKFGILSIHLCCRVFKDQSGLPKPWSPSFSFPYVIHAIKLTCAMMNSGSL